MNRIPLSLYAVVLFLSGASALTYEIIWQRQMYLIFGASAPATTAILTAIFLGIAFGSRFAVPCLQRAERPLLLYAQLELVMALWGAIVPWAIQLSGHFYLRAVATLGEGHLLHVPLRFVLAIVPLLPGTLAMGATIPVMVRCVAGKTGSAVALAYGVNILGAVGGCLSTGLIWIRWLGMLDTRFVAVACNLAAAILLWQLNRRHWKTEQMEPRVQVGAANVESQIPRRLGVLYFLAGFVALGMEVVWLRFLGIVNSSSTTTFTIALAVYLAGMGLGSLLFYPLFKRHISPQAVFSIANGGTALAALVTFPTLYLAASLNVRWIIVASKAGSLTVGDIFLTEFVIISMLMFVPTLMMGLAYPAVCDSFTGEGAAKDRWVGQTYFWGTLGSVLGILAVGMLLIPATGLHGTFAFLVSISSIVCFAALQFHLTDRVWKQLAAGLACAMIGWAAWIAFNPRPVLRETIAVYRDGGWIEVAPGDEQRIVSKLISFRAGTSATVVIKEEVHTSDRLVYVDDQLVASTNLGARVDALMLAHLPLLLHPDPTSALTVGFGTGGTSYAMTTHGIDTDCVEIEAEVPRSAMLTEQQNFGVLDNPRFTLIINDARDHLYAGTSMYDVIATDVTNLQYKQNGNLYTVEYFRLMQEKLNPGGVACAWIPMASINTDELRILMRGFIEVFPHATMWYLNHTHTNFGILIGTAEPLQIDYSRLEQGFANPDIAANMKLIGMTEPLQLVHCLHLDEDGYREFCGNAPLHTDDLPILEFSSLMSTYLYYETFRDNLEATLQLRPRDFQRYVVNTPNGIESEFAKHETASRSFCKMIASMYRFIINQERAEFIRAQVNLESALEDAQSGMRAWPDDNVRRDFYAGFFSTVGLEFVIPTGDM